MARSLRPSRYNDQQLASVQFDPAIYAQPIRPFGFKGHDRTSPVSRVGEGYLRLVRDLLVRDGRYITRPGTSTLGNSANNPIVHALEVILSTEQSYGVRFLTSGVEVYRSAWEATGGVAWSTTNERPFSVTSWGDTLVFADDTNGIYSLPFTAGFIKTKLTNLIGVRHLTTFDGRILASVKDRVVWCVKNDNRDWTGIGSGYEDLKGGTSETQTAVVPLSDDTALVIRSQSVWLCSVTGNFDAPLHFTKIASGKGGRWPKTVVGITGGAFWLGYEGAVWLYDGQQIREVGQPIYKELIQAKGFLRDASAMHDPRYNEFRLCIPNGSTESTVHRFSRVTEGWTQDKYGFPIKSLAYSSLLSNSITVDEAEGTVDEQEGTVDDYGIETPGTAIFTMMDPGRDVVVEDTIPHGWGFSSDFSDDFLTGARDIAVGVDEQFTTEFTTQFGGLDVATEVPGTFRVETAFVSQGDPYRRTEVLQIITEYETAIELTLHFDYSDDGGKTWISLVDVPISITDKPTQLVLDYPLDRDSIQFALTSPDVTSFDLIDFHVRARAGGMKGDAH